MVGFSQFYAGDSNRTDCGSQTVTYGSARAYSSTSGPMFTSSLLDERAREYNELAKRAQYDVRTSIHGHFEGCKISITQPMFRTLCNNHGHGVATMIRELAESPKLRRVVGNELHDLGADDFLRVSPAAPITDTKDFMSFSLLDVFKT